jgi:hypothetical protein
LPCCPLSGFSSGFSKKDLTRHYDGSQYNDIRDNASRYNKELDRRGRFP